MIYQHFFIVSSFTKTEKHLLKVKRKDYLRYKKKIVLYMKRYGVKSKRKMNYPVYRKNRKSYVVYGVVKMLRMADVMPIDVWKFTITKR